VDGVNLLGTSGASTAIAGLLLMKGAIAEQRDVAMTPATDCV
jgi:hypothetical protein